MAAPAQTTTSVKHAPNAKHFIVAALMVVLFAAVIVTVFFIVLSPARITFSISDASSQIIYAAGNKSVQQALNLTLTLSANNTSTRARVQYDSIYIDLSNNTGPRWENWFRTDMATRMPLLQPELNQTKINATLSFPLQGASWAAFFTGNMTSNAFSVMVTAVARFRVGFARTRLYDIKVKCGPVSFFRGATNRNGVPPAPLPVPCG
ncbi:unnamed protein product [Urochloa humidicola]